MKDKKILIIEINPKTQDIKILKNKQNNNEQKNSIENIYEKFYNEKKEDNEIIEIKKTLHLFSTNGEEKSEIEILKQIKMWKEKYDVILIDIEKYFTSLFEEIDKIIFLTEANILQIKKSKIYLEENIKNYKIEQEKINIVFNKTTKDAFSINILKSALKEYNLLGKVNNINNCNLLINHNMNQAYLEKHIKMQYQKIGNEILKNKNTKNYYLNKINN